MVVELTVITSSPTTPDVTTLTVQDGTINSNNSKPKIEKQLSTTINKDQLEIIRNNLLCTNEVTFCEHLNDDDDDDDDNVIDKYNNNDSDIDEDCSILSNSITPIKCGGGGGGGSINSNRRRINSNETDNDSIISSVYPGSSGTIKKKPAIPDGGFGWIVVFSSLLLSLIADGISFSFGLIYTEFLNYFQESKSKTAWIGSLFLAVPLLSGPIMSNLVDKYGCRKMTIIGGLISGSGFVLAAFSNSIEMLYLTFGVIAGLGLGIGYVTAVVSIAFWFDKKRTFATGIGASGTGIGTFIYAPFTQWLIETYGWRGTTLILAGTLFNICVCGTLMRDPDWLIEQNNSLQSRSQSITTFSNSSVCLDEIKKLLETGAPKEAVLDTLVTNYNTEANQQIKDPIEEHIEKKYTSELLLPTYLCSQEFGINGTVRHGSRRSLRKKNKDEEEEFKKHLFIISNNDANKPINNENSNVVTIKIDNEKKNTIDNNKHLASMETLNISEKITYDDNDSNNSSDNSIIESIRSGEVDEGYMTYKFGKIQREPKYSVSSYSLDESVFNGGGGGIIMNSTLANNNDSNIGKNNIKRSFVGTSLDVLFENDGYRTELSTVVPAPPPPPPIPSPAQQPDNTLHLNDGLEDNLNKNSSVENVISIPVPIFKPQKLKQINASKSHHHHQRNNIFASNLRYNPSLRYSNYFRNMRIHRNSIHYRGAMLNTHRYRLRASSCPNIYRNSMTTLAREDEEKWYDNFLDIIRSIFDFSLFLDVKFSCIQCSTLLLFIWFIVPYFYITEHMLSFGYTEEDAANLISVIGVFNTIGMISLGWAGDQPWLNVPKTYAFCLVLCGISVALIPIFVQNYIVLMLLATIFGLTFASSFSFTPIILVSLVDLDDFTCAYGLVLLIQGVGNLIGPPLAGFMFEMTLSWDSSFYASGFFIGIAGVLAYITGLLQDCDAKRQKILENKNVI